MIKAKALITKKDITAEEDAGRSGERDSSQSRRGKAGRAIGKKQRDAGRAIGKEAGKAGGRKEEELDGRKAMRSKGR